MRTQSPRIIVVTALVLGVASTEHRASNKDPRVVVAAYLDASDATMRNDRVRTSTDPRQILLDSSVLVPDFLLLRASMMMHSGGPHFLLATRKGRLFRLGGFPDPEPGPFWSAVSDRWKSSETSQAWGALLARVLNPRGNASIIPTTDTAVVDRREIALAWHQVRPSQWPADTTWLLAGGSTRVSITTLSPSDEEETPGVWNPITYTFTFDKGRRLVAWAMHTGNDFIVRSR